MLLLVTIEPSCLHTLKHENVFDSDQHKQLTGFNECAPLRINHITHHRVSYGSQDLRHNHVCVETLEVKKNMFGLN